MTYTYIYQVTPLAGVETKANLCMQAGRRAGNMQAGKQAGRLAGRQAGRLAHLIPGFPVVVRLSLGT